MKERNKNKIHRVITSLNKQKTKDKATAVDVIYWNKVKLMV